MPKKSELQKRIDLLNRCKNLGVYTVNKNTGKTLSDSTLRKRCTKKNSEKYKTKKKKKRKGRPLKQAPEYKGRLSLPVAVTLDRNSSYVVETPKNRQQTVILRKLPIDTDNLYAGSIEVLRY